MNVKSVIALFLFLSLCIGVGGRVMTSGKVSDTDIAVGDSSIAIVAYFCKNDTMKYVRTVNEITVDGGDTISRRQKQREEFMLVVRDSTSDGYVIEFIPVDFQYGDSGADDLKSKMASILKNSYKDLRAVFKTDELGSIKSLENWKEIRDKMKVSVKAMFDSLYSVEPAIDSIMPRTNIEALATILFSSEEGVCASYDEMNTLFELHGSMIDIGQHTIDDMEKDSSYTTVFVGYGPYDDYGYEEDYNIMAKSVTKYNMEETRDLLGGVFNLLFKDSVAGKLDQVVTDSIKNGMTVTMLQDYNLFYNGWPCVMRKQKTVEFGRRTNVSTDEIRWVYRSWHQYATKQPKGHVASF